MGGSLPKILLLDDDLNVLKLLKRALGHSYELLVAPTGYELELMIHHFKPDLIVMDLELPDDNGAHICRRLRKHAEYDGIAILILSGLDETSVATAAIQGGADGFLTKPFDISILHSTIAHIIESKRQNVWRSAPATGAHP